ncbi:MAG: sensor histidine kinase [Leptolyngbyaceae cyanobacterium]
MTLSALIRPKNHPFPFLLHLEWVLLALAIFSELTPAPLPDRMASPGLALASLLIFGALGLCLPTRNLGLSILHILGQFILILVASQAGLAGLRLFAFLYLILLTRSCLMVGMVGRLLVLATSFILFVGVVQVRLRVFSDRLDRLPPWAERRLVPLLMGMQVNITVLFAVLLVFVLLTVNALLAERQRREELHQANAQLRASAAQIESLALAQERSRIAREIHDSLGHSLTGLNIQLEGALKLWQGNPTQAKAFVQQAKTLGTNALNDVRQAVAAVRSDPLQGQSLDQAIATLVAQFQQTTGITPSLRVIVPSMSPALAAAIYRIVQEALTNICKHAQATTVVIALQRCQHQSEAGITLEIEDNGQGFVPQDNQTGFGLQGIQERVKAMGGIVTLNSNPGQGCALRIWFPLPRPTS